MILSLLISPYWNVNHNATISSSQCRQLLISPYWNVNRSNKPGCMVIVPPFNLSILECKLARLERDCFKCFMLLISPYWNVNHDSRANRQEATKLLISPYWNVNDREGCTVWQGMYLLISPYWNVNGDFMNGGCCLLAF